MSQTTAPTKPKEWWRGAVIYQVYPRSFQDSNNDGIGDLTGLIQRMPYIASLGIDAIWLSPIFQSPQKDFGYDVSSYKEIDPLFGNTDDCDLLIAEAHKLGIKVIFDVVLSHSSDQHPWFQDSRRKLDSKDDWYVWANPKPDGSPPNNWVALFGGPAWTFDPLRGQYYLHNFLESQPDFNFHEPAVQDAILDIIKYWMDRGIDGLRLDVVNFYFHDKLLRNNPPRPADMGFALQYEHPDPYSMQRHLYDKSQPENLEFIERMRALVDTYDNRMLVGEIGDDFQIKRMAEYTQGNKRLHTAYCFALLGGTNVDLTAQFIKTALEEDLAAGEGWPTWAFSNHDVPRAPTRFGLQFIGNKNWPKMLLALQTSLRGTICLYQGEELGLPEAQVPHDRLQDPWGKRVWPVWQGRDGCRTPIPWDDTLPYAGFSKTEPWLPNATEHQGLAVASQERDAQSSLHETRRLLAFRKMHPALIDGDITFLSDEGKALTFTRQNTTGKLFCAFNLGDTPLTIKIPAPHQDGIFNQASFSGDMLALGAFGFAIVPIG